MTSFSRVPVVDVHNDNLREVWPSMVLAMSSATHIALDTELSGLGHRKKLNAKSVEERYKNICETARTRSVLSLGISCFKQISAPCTAINQSEGSINNQSGSSFIVQTYNILLLCEEDYTVEPMSLKFLVQHGFDFNKQYEKGISYYRGADKPTDHSIQSVRHLFTELVSMKVPIVLHNGLVDLMFMYENLYTSLPMSSAAFLADLVDMFPAGIVDTKYITDFEHLMQASYLEYVFRKCQKDNGASSPGCSVHFPHYPDTYPYVTYRNCSLKPAYNISHNEEGYKGALCETYAGHGWCSKGQYCAKSHDIDLIIDMDNYMATRKSRKRKRRKENSGTKQADNASLDSSLSELMDTENRSESAENDLSETENSDFDIGKINDELGSKVNVSEELNLINKEAATATHANGGHRAGYDAFMTGFIYSVFIQQVNKTGDGTKIQEWMNKLYLGGKDYPLSVSKSSFSKQSKQHLEKISRIRQKGSHESVDI